MNAIFRSLIVWLVLLALPYQGFAAAAALPCAPAPAQEHHALAAGAMHDHAAMMHHGHDGRRAAPARHDGSGHHAGAKCGSCAACFIGAALPPAVAALGVQPAQSVTIPFAAGHLPAFHPSLPDRPPRSSLA